MLGCVGISKYIRLLLNSKQMLLPKRLLFGFFVFLIGFSASAQHRFNYALGYNTGIHLKNGGLDFVVDRYNQNNSLLTQKLQSPRFFFWIKF